MIRKSIRCVALAVFGVFLISGVSLAAGKKKSPDGSHPDEGAVNKVLRAEVVGQIDRRSLLADMLRDQPDSSIARWQAGYIRVGKSWQPFEATPAAPDSGPVAEYVSQRDQTPATFADQLKLANWCKRHALADRERAHLWAALESAATADRPEILLRLGYFPVGNGWLSGSDLSLWRERNRRALGSLKRWGPRLEKIARQLEGLPNQRETGRTALSQLTDPAAIAAIEYLLCSSPAAAGPAINALARWSDVEATLALVKQSVFSERPEIRRQATEALKGRPLEDFAPALISTLATAAATSSANHGMWQFDLGNSGEGVGVFILRFSYLIARETGDQFQVSVLNTTDYRVGEWLQQGNTVSILHESSEPQEIGPAVVRARLITRQSELNRERADLEYQAEKLIDEMNERTDELNQRIINVLAAVSGQSAVPDVKAWWRWWESFTETQYTDEKPSIVTVGEDYVGDPSTHYHRVSCFAAGTLVWTERGPASIENIKVGDLVLAQNVETGELTHKPVLKTTVRPPRELTMLRVGDETIVCTGGHRFWVSGSGWIKARDLESHSLLHTVTGNTPLWSAKKGQTAETYNLVVADLHTYFVGKAGLLCQDLALPGATKNVVPGLSRVRAAAPTKD